MLKATIREFMGSDELSRQRFTLDPGEGEITIGRSSECVHQIGSALGQWALGIARVQATITFDNGQITLLDGTREKPSTNGIWAHGDQIRGAIVLVPGLELTLFKSGRAKVCFLVSDGNNTDHGNAQDTYTGEDLLSILQEQIDTLKTAVPRLELEVGKLAQQLAQREAIDAHQTEQLLLVQKRLNKVLFVLFASVAAIVLASGWLGGSSKEREQLSSTLTSFAIAAVAVYFKSKEKELEGERDK